MNRFLNTTLSSFGGLILGLGSLSVMAGPPNADHIPVDAETIIHIDFEAVADSTIGRKLFESDDINLDPINELRRISEYLDIEPLKDIKSITMYGNNMQDGPDAIIAVGSSAADNLIAKLQEGEESYEAVQIDGFTVHRWDDASAYLKEDGDDRILVISQSLDNLLDAVKVIEGDKPSKSRRDIPSIKRGTIIFAQAAKLDWMMEDNGDDDAGVIIAEKAKTVVALIGEDANELFALITAETDSEDDAKDVVTVGQAALVIFRTMADRGNEKFKPFEDLLWAMSIDAVGRRIEFEMRIEVDKLPLDEIGDL